MTERMQFTIDVDGCTPEEARSLMGEIYTNVMGITWHFEEANPNRNVNVGVRRNENVKD